MCAFSRNIWNNDNWLDKYVVSSQLEATILGIWFQRHPYYVRVFPGKEKIVKRIVTEDFRNVATFM